MAKKAAAASGPNLTQKGFKFRRSVGVEAAYFDGERVGLRNRSGNVKADSAPKWFPPISVARSAKPEKVSPGHVVLYERALLIGTPEGLKEAPANFWIVRGSDGSLTPFAPADFERLHEPA